MRRCAVFWLPALTILQFSSSSAAQIKATLAISEGSKIRVAGEYRTLGNASKNFYFLKDYADMGGLGERFGEVAASDHSDRPVQIKRLIPGEYLASKPVRSWSYTVDATPHKQLAGAAHVSWISDGIGLLFLDDLLPQAGSTNPKAAAEIELRVPPEWKIYTTEKVIRPNVYAVGDVAKSVFLVSKNNQTRKIVAAGGKLDLYIAGEWQFSDAEASGTASEIYNSYSRIFQDGVGAANIYLVRFPQSNVKPGNWEAGTRGNSITIASSDMPFKTQSLQRLHEQLRHEIFHFWIPGNLALTGKYDWFYEGFTLYLSLKQGLSVNRLRFEDFLDTLSRAYNIDSIQPEGVSLVKASEQRWAGGNARIYARGMIAAFLMDLAMLQRSKGKVSIEALMGEVYEKHRNPAESDDGNSSVVEIMLKRSELEPIVRRYIIGAEKLDWKQELNVAGIESIEENFLVRLKTVAKPSRRQKDLLDRLGYNNWRNLSPSSK